VALICETVTQKEKERENEGEEERDRDRERCKVALMFETVVRTGPQHIATCVSCLNEMKDAESQRFRIAEHFARMCER